MHTYIHHHCRTIPCCKENQEHLPSLCIYARLHTCTHTYIHIHKWPWQVQNLLRGKAGTSIILGLNTDQARECINRYVCIYVRIYIISLCPISALINIYIYIYIYLYICISNAHTPARTHTHTYIHFSYTCVHQRINQCTDRYFVCHTSSIRHKVRQWYL